MARRWRGRVKRNCNTGASERKVQNSKRSFLDLPREIRDQIYFLVLRPDISEHVRENDEQEYTPCLGCTAILRVCRRIHEEARQLLAAKEQVIEIHGRNRAVFRSMFSHGKPGYFRCYSKLSSIYIPPRYCELQVVRFRRLLIDIHYPTKQDPHDRGGGRREPEDLSDLQAEFKQIVNVLQKTQALESLRIRVQGYGEAKPSDSVVQRLMEMLFPMVSVAKAKHFKLSAESNKFFPGEQYRKPCSLHLPYHDYQQYVHSYEEDVVKRFNQICGKNDLLPEPGLSLYPERPSFHEFKDKRYHQRRKDKAEHILQNFQSVRPDSLPPHKEEYGTPLGNWEPEDWSEESTCQDRDLEVCRNTLPDASLPSWHQCLERYTPKMPDSQTLWALAPECRKCMQIFANSTELREHLAKYPEHQTKWFKRRENSSLHPDATRSVTKHKCATCAWAPLCGFETFARLERHREQYRHFDKKMVTRWQLIGRRVDTKKRAKAQ